MNIGFDIDGVLTNLEEFQLKYGAPFFKKKYNIDIANPNGESIREIFSCSESQEYEFWKKNIFFYATKYPMRVSCLEYIKKIKEDAKNIKIFIISSRIKTSDKDLVGFLMRILVKRFLKDVPYEDITFCSIKNSPVEKVNACLKYKIDLMIEDTVKNILALKDVTKVVCFDASYNKDLPKDIIRITSYDELFRIVNSMNEERQLKILSSKEKRELDEQKLQEYYQKLQEYYIKRINRKALTKSENVYQLLYPIMKKIFDTKFHYTVINLERNVQNRNAIYISNHRDMIDPPLLMSIIGKKPTHLLLKSEFKDSAFEPFLTAIGCCYVKRDNTDSQKIAKEQLIKAALAGANVIILPEGTRNKTAEELLPFKLGAVSISRTTGVPIVPVGIYKKFDDFSTDIILNIGEPINVEYTDDITLINEDLEENVKQLILEAKEYQIEKAR